MLEQQAGPASTEERLSDVLGVLALAGDMGRGQPLGHVHRTCFIAMRTAHVMGLSTADLADVYHTALLIHAGCTAGIHHFAAFLASDELAAQRDLCLCDTENLRQMLGWVRRNVAPSHSLPVRVQRTLQLFITGSQLMGEVDGGCSEVGARIAERLGLSAGTRNALYHICETWSGKGPHRLKGNDIPLATRVANASMVLEVFANSHGPEAARQAATQRRGRSFDPAVADAFLEASAAPGFWDELARDDLWQQVVGMDPSPQPIDDQLVEKATEAIADFTDLKSAHGATHSRAVAELAAAVATKLGLPANEVTLARRAGYVHDLGQIGVPALALRKTSLSVGEAELFRLHPYHTEQLLSRAPSFADVGRIAGMHHEQPNGEGYYRGISGQDIPMVARVVATANAYHGSLVAEPGPGDIERALQELRNGASTRYDGDCVEALTRVVQAQPKQRHAAPAGLTEREVEVLRLLASGLSNKQIAAQLVISEKTVGHHVEHVYEKIGVSTRAGATLFAMENRLLA